MENFRRVVIDIEANSLNPDIIWCIVAIDIDTDEIFKFYPNSPTSGHKDWEKEYKKFDKEIGTYIGHNLIGYDIPVMNRLLGLDIKIKDVVDTLVLSRLFRPVSPFKPIAESMKKDNRIGGHSLDAWGQRLGFQKIHFNDFSKFSQQMLEYCVRDVELNRKVFDKLVLEKEGFSDLCIELEHKVAYWLDKQVRNGFYLDQEKAKTLVKETEELIADAIDKLHICFPPVKKVLTPEYPIVYRKSDGEVSSRCIKMIDKYSNTEGLTIEKVREDVYELGMMEEFNPGSSKQIAERLLALGWTPKKYTDKGNPKTDKDTLKEAIDELLEANPDKPELEYLKKYSILTDRNQKASKWLELVEEDGRVHGQINPIGAGTHRCSHYNDNMANIARVSTSATEQEGICEDYKDFELFSSLPNNRVFLGCKNNKLEYGIKGIEGNFGWDSRDCWSVPEGKVLVGADASGIQLRGLAHYMNDTAYTKALLEADIHVVNQNAAGIDTRNKAKTFIYAWLLGAGDEKVGMIVGVTEDEYDSLFAWAETQSVWNTNLLRYIANRLRKEGRPVLRKTVATIIKGYKVKEQFLERTPALKRLRKEDIPKATEQGYLIGLDGRKLWIPNEHLAMSLYLQGFEAVIMKLAMVYYSEELLKKDIPFKQVNFVHDEFQIETEPSYGKEVGEAVVRGIIKAGEVLGSNCPLDGEYKIGKSWAQTH